MKRYLPLLFLSFFGLLAAHGQVQPRETVLDGLRGKVAKVDSRLYVAIVEGDAMRRGEALEHLETIYNAKGQRRSISYLSTEEDLLFRTRYKHDAFGYTTLEHIVDNNDAVIGRTYYVYDPNFVLTETYIEDAERQVESRTRYRYDATGRLTQRSYNDPLGQVFRREMLRYNGDGTLLSNTIYDRQDQKVMEIRYEYDRYRQPVSKTVFDYSEEEAEIFVTLYRYQYDDQGNWVQRTEYSVDGGNTTPEYITERTIQYF